MKFYQELKSNNVVIVPNGEVVSGDFKEITANTVDASKEKHVPVVSYGDTKMTVTVGSVEHPMEEAHYIMWIAVIKGNDVQIQKLNPGDKPMATFEKINDAEVYAYCNLHGLWKA